MSARSDALMSRAEAGKIAPRPSFSIVSGCHSASTFTNNEMVHWFLFVDVCFNSAHDLKTTTRSRTLLLGAEGRRFARRDRIP
jgi:hypothetical protein